MNMMFLLSLLIFYCYLSRCAPWKVQFHGMTIPEEKCFGDGDGSVVTIANLSDTLHKNKFFAGERRYSH